MEKTPSAGAVVTNRVTDPYSVALTANSEQSLVVDLDDPALAPDGWARTTPPTIEQPEDRNVYELHAPYMEIPRLGAPET